MLGRLVVRRQEKGEPARRLHGLRVGVREQRRLLVPDSEARLLDGRAETDRRASHCGVTYAPDSPPSIRNVDAVTYEDSSLARNRAPLAISRACAKRPIGRWIIRRMACSGSLA